MGKTRLSLITERTDKRLEEKMAPYLDRVLTLSLIQALDERDSYRLALVHISNEIEKMRSQAASAKWDGSWK